jgi:hypothetical protein
MMVTINTTFNHQITAVVAAITTTHFFFNFSPFVAAQIRNCCTQAGIYQKGKKVKQHTS